MVFGFFIGLDSVLMGFYHKVGFCHKIFADFRLYFLVFFIHG